MTGDRRSLILAVNHRLQAVGVLHSRSQTGDVDASRLRGHVSRGLPTQTGPNRQLMDKQTESAGGGLWGDLIIVQTRDKNKHLE